MPFAGNGFYNRGGDVTALDEIYLKASGEKNLKTPDVELVQASSPEAKAWAEDLKAKHPAIHKMLLKHSREAYENTGDAAGEYGTLHSIMDESPSKRQAHLEKSLVYHAITDNGPDVSWERMSGTMAKLRKSLGSKSIVDAHKDKSLVKHLDKIGAFGSSSDSMRHEGDRYYGSDASESDNIQAAHNYKLNPELFSRKAVHHLQRKLSRKLNREPGGVFTPTEKNAATRLYYGKNIDKHPDYNQWYEDAFMRGSDASPSFTIQSHWSIQKRAGKYHVIKADGTDEGESESLAKAKAHLRALYANAGDVKGAKPKGGKLNFQSSAEKEVADLADADSSHGEIYQIARNHLMNHVKNRRLESSEAHAIAQGIADDMRPNEHRIKSSWQLTQQDGEPVFVKANHAEDSDRMSMRAEEASEAADRSGSIEDHQAAANLHQSANKMHMSEANDAERSKNIPLSIKRAKIARQHWDKAMNHLAVVRSLGKNKASTVTLIRDGEPAFVKAADIHRISKPVKNEYGEYVVKWMTNGKRDENKTYYTDDLKDAFDTHAHMTRHAEELNRKSGGSTHQPTGETFVDHPHQASIVTINRDGEPVFVQAWMPSRNSFASKAIGFGMKHVGIPLFMRTTRFLNPHQSFGNSHKSFFASNRANKASQGVSDSASHRAAGSLHAQAGKAAPSGDVRAYHQAMGGYHRNVAGGMKASSEHIAEEKAAPAFANSHLEAAKIHIGLQNAHAKLGNTADAAFHASMADHHLSVHNSQVRKVGATSVEVDGEIYVRASDEQPHQKIRRGEYGRGWFIKKDNSLHDVTSDFGGGTNDHVGSFEAMEHPEKLGVSKETAKKASKEAEEGDYGEGHRELWNQVFKAGNIRVREFGQPGESNHSIGIEGDFGPSNRWHRKIQEHMAAGRIPYHGNANYYVENRHPGAIRRDLSVKGDDLFNASRVDQLVRSSDHCVSRRFIQAELGGYTPRSRQAGAQKRKFLSMARKEYGFTAGNIEAQFRQEFEGLGDLLKKNYLLERGMGSTHAQAMQKVNAEHVGASVVQVERDGEPVFIKAGRGSQHYLDNPAERRQFHEDKMKKADEEMFSAQTKDPTTFRLAKQARDAHAASSNAYGSNDPRLHHKAAVMHTDLAEAMNHYSGGNITHPLQGKRMHHLGFANEHWNAEHILTPIDQRRPQG